MYLMRKPPNTGVHEARILVLFLIEINKESIKQRADTQFSEKIQESKTFRKIFGISQKFWIFGFLIFGKIVYLFSTL